MKRLLITRPLPESVLQAARDCFDVTVLDPASGLDAPSAAQALAQFDGILCTLGDDFGTSAFAGTIRCGMLANFGVGYNHIDVAAAQAAGAMVSNTPGAVTDATADLAMTLILMASRRAAQGERWVRTGSWPGWQPLQLLGHQVTGRTLGVVGMGRIGQAIARRAHFGFGMPVLYFNRSARELGYPARRVPDLGDLMGQADVVVIALPGGAQTRHMIDAQAFSRMKPDAVFVNVARGDIVDEGALIAALERGQFAAAGLDVYEHEPKVPEALRQRDDVTLLPHLGTNVLEVRRQMGKMALANLLAFNKGERPPNLIQA